MDAKKWLEPGDIVMIRRGSDHIYGTKGKERWVIGVVHKARTFDPNNSIYEYECMLLQDDLFATNGYCTRIGDVGHWGEYAVKLLDDM